MEEITKVCNLLGVSPLFIIGFICFALFEYWLGKNEQYRANSTVQAIELWLKALLQKKGPGPL